MVIVIAIEQGHSDVRVLTQFAGAIDARESAANDHHVLQGLDSFNRRESEVISHAALSGGDSYRLGMISFAIDIPHEAEATSPPDRSIPSGAKRPLRALCRHRSIRRSSHSHGNARPVEIWDRAHFTGRRPLSFFKNIWHRSIADLFRNLINGHKLTGASWAFNLEVVAVIVNETSVATR